MRSRHSPLIELFALNDQELARRAARDGAAFAELLHRHLRSVYRYLAAVSGSAAEARELTARTFMTAFESIDVYWGEPGFLSWLIEIARDQVARQGRPQKEKTPPGPAAAAGNSALHPRLGLEQVSAALARLEPERAEAIRLYLFAGLSAAETAGVLKKSPAAAKNLLLHGLRDLLKAAPPLQEAG